jgi:putative beta-lysine N-acetyltransferase
LAKIYGRVFESYPFPIHQPDYIKEMMTKAVSYFCIRIDNAIAAAAAAEVDSLNLNCEMTDFATLPEHRGKGLAGMLLKHMDDKARCQGVKTAYTIARADSPGMNVVFKRRGYRYGGRLNKNSQIGGGIRSMNVWYRRL